MRFNKTYSLCISILFFIITLAVLVLAITTWHNPEDRVWGNTDVAVVITCDAGASTTYIRHCWATAVACDPGETEESTCLHVNGVCTVSTSENDPNDGQWYLVSKCKDATTWSTTNTTGTYDVDDEKPLVYYIAPTPANNTYTTSTSLTVNVTFWDLHSGFANLTYILVNSTAEINRTTYTPYYIANGNPGGNSSLTFTSLTDDTYHYNVTGNDVAGNKNFTLTRTITIDTTNPLIDFTTNTPINNTNTTSSSILINVTILDANPSNVTFVLVNSTAEINRTYLTTSSSGNYSLNFTSLENDVYRFNVTATDKVGNKNFTLTRTMTLDSSVPIIKFIASTPTNASSQSSTTVYVNTTVFDTSLLSDIASCILTWQATNYTMTKTANNANNKNVTCNYTLTSLSVATYTYKVLANDSLGNTNQTNTKTVTIYSSDNGGNGGGGGGGGGTCSCTTGARKCVGDSIEECSGSYPDCWQTVEECSSKETCKIVNGEPECVCQPSLVYGEWSSCIDGKRSRTVTDKNKCIATKTEVKSCMVGNETEECIPNWVCSDWSKCKAGYDIDKIILGDTSSFTKPNEQERICIDLNNCNSNRIEKKECGKTPIELKKDGWCFVEHTIILDNGKEVARIRPVLKQGLPRVDIDIGELSSLSEQVYCWYCEDGVKDYDEIGVDCGGPSCPACGITIKIERLVREYSQILYWLLIVLLALIALFLIWLELRNLRRRYILARLKAIYSLIHHKKHKEAMHKFYKLKKRYSLERFKEKSIRELHHRIARILLAYKARHMKELGRKSTRAKS